MSSNGSSQPEHSLQRSNSLKNSSKKQNNIFDDFSFSFKGVFKFFSSSYGAVMTFPIMAFNGLTTVNGAGILLPPAIGYPLGGFLSFVYFTLVVNSKISRKHPFRTCLLTIIFCIASTYTSFFSIYKQLSNDSDSFANQAKEKAISNHDKFLTDFRNVLSIHVERINKNTKLIDYKNSENKLVELQNEHQKLSAERKDYESNGFKSLAGYTAKKIKEIDNEIKSTKTTIQNIESDNKINRILAIDRILDQLQNKLDRNQNQLDRDQQKLIERDLEQSKSDLEIRQDTIKSNSSFSNFLQKILPSIIDGSENKNKSNELATYYQEDKQLYDELTSIPGIDIEEGIISKPIYDNYRKTPVFLIPLELAFGSAGGRRQLSFIVFSLIVAITFEVIPLLLGGINEEDNESNEDKYKFDLLSNRLNSAIFASKINKFDDVEDFLIYFYLQIDHSDRKIYLSNLKTHGDSDNYILATLLFCDLMTLEKIGLINKIINKIPEEQSNSSKDLKVNNIVKASPLSNIFNDESIQKLFNTYPKTKVKSDVSVEWQFVNESAYQLFLKYLLRTINGVELEGFTGEFKALGKYIGKKDLMDYTDIDNQEDGKN